MYEQIHNAAVLMLMLLLVLLVFHCPIVLRFTRKRAVSNGLIRKAQPLQSPNPNPNPSRRPRPSTSLMPNPSQINKYMDIFLADNQWCLETPPHCVAGLAMRQAHVATKKKNEKM